MKIKEGEAKEEEEILFKVEEEIDSQSTKLRLNVLNFINLDIFNTNFIPGRRK